MIEASGASLLAIVEGFKAFRSVAVKYMQAHNLILSRTGTLEPDKWYSMHDWISIYGDIAKEVGENVLFDIGEGVPKHAIFPPEINNIRIGIQSIDVAYHMNHRFRGQPMFNPATGVMLEGIGHYGYTEVPGEKKIVSVCDNPYPCRFDHGILSSMAKRFEPRAVVVHDDKKGCRSRGGPSCTFVITW
jgi:hypothetical protein